MDLGRESDRVRLELNGDHAIGEIVEPLLAVAKDTETTITGINSTSRRLEDAYLKLITEDEFRGFLRASKS